MRACWRKSSKRSLKTQASLIAAIMGEGVNNCQSPSAVFHFALFRGEGLSDHASEGDGAAAAVAGRHARIRVGIVRTRVDARDVQAFNRLAIAVDSLEVFVNRNAVERAQHVARSANAIERRRANCRQAMRVFSEIGVDALGSLEHHIGWCAVAEGEDTRLACVCEARRPFTAGTYRCCRERGIGRRWFVRQLLAATSLQRNRMVAQDLAARLLEAAEARSHSPNAK